MAAEDKRAAHLGSVCAARQWLTPRGNANKRLITKKLDYEG